MRIAIPCDQGLIFQCFDRAPQFKICEIERRQILMETTVEPIDKGRRAVADLLRAFDVRAVVCGNIDEGAMRALTEADILFYGGVSGPVDDAIAALLNGALAYDPSIRCEPRHDQECGDDCTDCGGDCADCAGCAHGG